MHKLAVVLRKVPFAVKIAYYLYRFFQSKYTVGVVGVVLNTERQVLLVEHVFHPKLPWGLPGGWVGWNEDPANALVRELKEELDLEVTIEAIVKVRRTHRFHLDISYLCSTMDVVGDLSFELLEYGWYDLDALPVLHTFHTQSIQQVFAEHIDGSD